MRRLWIILIVLGLSMLLSLSFGTGLTLNDLAIVCIAIASYIAGRKDKADEPRSVPTN
jgi:ABC-type nickel/cobalt efflux system permease component RcnA